MTAQWSSLCLLETLFRGYLDCLWSCGVLGHQKVSDARIFFFCVAMDAFQHCFVCLQGLWFGLALALGGALASFLTFGAIFMKRYPNLLRVKVEAINYYARPLGIHHDCSGQTRTCGFLKETNFVVVLGGMNTYDNKCKLPSTLLGTG